MKNLFIIVLFCALVACANAQERNIRAATQAQVNDGANQALYVSPRTLSVALGTRSAYMPLTTPWAYSGNLGTNALPWTMLRTVAATNAGVNSQFPSACYDWAHGRIVGAYIESSNHLSSDGVGHLVFSSDGGQTWTDKALDLSIPAGAGVACLGVNVDSSGALLLSVLPRAWDGLGSGYGDLTYYPFEILTTTDDGDTFVTNSFVGTDTNMCASNPILITSKGTWLMPVYSAVTSSNATVWRSDNRGQSWSSIPTDNTGNEGFMLAHRGWLYLLVRSGNGEGGGPHMLISTNDGLNWDLIGKVHNNDSSPPIYPAAAFCGDRLYLVSREQPYSYSGLYYSDAAPYYTNGWHYAGLRSHHPSLYDAPVNLSPSVVLWLSSFDHDSAFGAKTNSWLECIVQANDAEGYALHTTAQPLINLKRSGIPGLGSAFKVWPDYGSLGWSPTNNLNLPGPLPAYSQDQTGLGWFQNETNSLTWGTKTALTNAWQTNAVNAGVTFIWRAARTNGADAAYVLDDMTGGFHAGFGLRMYGASTVFASGNNAGTALAQNYTGGSFDTDYTLTPHVYAERIVNGYARYYEDGNFTSAIDQANAGDGNYSASASALSQLSVGAYGLSVGGTSIFLSDVMAFTNALTDNEVFQFMAEIKQRK